MSDEARPNLLRRLLQRPKSAEPESSATKDGSGAVPGNAEADGQEVEFWGYTEDARLYGFLQLEAERLSDLLNSAREIELDSVMVVALEDNRAVELKRLVVRPDELIAVRGLGPRGNAARRKRTRAAPVGMRAGPYIIHGYLHVPPGADPLLQFRRRRPMVPLTEGWIEYQSGSETHRARVGTVIVNRDYVEWIDHAKDAEVRVDLPVEARIDPRAKDFTGQIRVFREQRRDAAYEL